MSASPRAGEVAGATGVGRPTRGVGTRGGARRVRALLPLLVVLAVAAAVRVAVAITYAPALMWTDSWQYLSSVELPGGFAPDKPNGYMLVLRALGTGSHLGLVTALQHVAGLVGGVLLFALLRRLGCDRLVAAAATAVVLLDGYAIALEQHVLAEALFTSTLVGWAFLAVAAARTPAVASAASGLLVVAVAFRGAAIFVVPVWIVYALWRYRGVAARAAAVGVLVAGLGGYLAWHHASAGGWGLNQMDGLLLYGRVAEIGECPGRSVPARERPLCPSTAEDPGGWGDEYAYALFSDRSAALRAVGNLYSLPPDRRLAADARLRSFATRVIRERPLAFARLVIRDTARQFVPGEMSPLRNFDDPITLPEAARPVPPVAQNARRLLAPGYRPPPAGGARALPAYQRWVHTPRWLLGLLLLASGAALVLRVARGWPVAHAGELALLSGAGLALVVGGAVNHFEPRFLLPAVPLLVAGGTVALSDLAAAAARRRPRAAA